MRVALDDEGDAVIMWQASNGIHARARSAAGVLGPLEGLGGGLGPHSDSYFSIAMDEEGNAIFASIYNDLNGSSDWVVVGTRSRTGTYGPVKIASKVPPNSIGWPSRDPHVVIGRDGQGVIVWQTRSFQSVPSIQARVLFTSGKLGPIETVSENDVLGRIALAANGNGDALITWANGRTSRIQVRARTAAGVYGRVETVSRRGVSAVAPSVVIDSIGLGTVVWQSDDGANTRIQASADE
jgi:hypothetical protein